MKGGACVHVLRPLLTDVGHAFGDDKRDGAVLVSIPKPTQQSRSLDMITIYGCIAHLNSINVHTSVQKGEQFETIAITEHTVFQ